MGLSSFYTGRRVLVTGHTGFKGAWMCRLLRLLGATVTGYALEPPTKPSLFSLAGIEKGMHSVIGDIRDLARLRQCVDDCRPEIVIHMAAQPLVRLSYQDPVGTYSTNVMGTVHVLQALRGCESVISIVNVTTDKVYLNHEWAWGYREADRLDGYDPYSNSKSCSELVTASYRRSFFSQPGSPAVSTCRAGNVIGGGDFAADRILPDCLRAVENGGPIRVRNPHSTRPYQHVLEPVAAYLTLACRQAESASLAGSYNIGPDETDCVTTAALVGLFCRHWGEGASWKDISEADAPHEAGFLKLDCSKIRAALGWKPHWGISKAVEKTVEWDKAYLAGEDVRAVMDAQIREYLANTAEKEG